MPQHLQSLVVIVALAAMAFAIAKPFVCAVAMGEDDFVRRRNLWFGITLIAFLSYNFWVYIVATGLLLYFGARRESSRIAMFFFLLLAVPGIPADITGLGVIRYFFSIDYVRLLALTVLLPAFLDLRKRPDTVKFGRTLPDKLLMAYFIQSFFLQFVGDTFTNTLRQSVFYVFVDVFLPYYVASRSVKDIEGFREVAASFVTAAMLLVPIGVFEFSKHWLLYSSLKDTLGQFWGMGGYLDRGDSLRALATVGQPIALGYVMAVAIGFFLYLRRSIMGSAVWWLGFAVLIAGLIVPVSRGPWTGAAALLLGFILVGPAPVSNLSRLALVGICAAPILFSTEMGDQIIAHLPFVGSVEEDTVDYRQRLLAIAVQIILENPLFGASDYLYSLQDLKQGQGIIDIVNTYLGIGLSNGLVGLMLFVGVFATIIWKIFRSLRKSLDKYDERYLLGQALLATLLSIMVIITTVSSITVIPVIYWSIAGLGVAYLQMSVAVENPQAIRKSAREGFLPAGTPVRS